MSDIAKDPILRFIRRLSGKARADGVTDRELLSRFVTQNDEAAFELLLRRYASLVQHVCRNVTRDHHHAEDVFQATFLVLARKARSIRNCDSLGGWLYRVAYRIALRVRCQTMQRTAQEKRGLDLRELPENDEACDAIELRPLLLEEVNRLPAKYRTPIILCYLEGKTLEEAAHSLGWPKGTVSGRLARARDLLRGRLVRRGLATSVAALIAALSPEETTAMTPIFRSVVQAAMRFANHGVGSTICIPPQSVLLAEGMLRTMYLTKIKAILATVLTMVVLGSGAHLTASHIWSTKPATEENVSLDSASAKRARAPGREKANAEAAVSPSKGKPEEPSTKPPVVESVSIVTESKPILDYNPGIWTQLQPTTDDKPNAQTPTAEEQFRTLVKEYDDGPSRVSRREPYEKRALKLAQENPKEPFAVDALLWVLKRGWQPNGGILMATTQPFGESASKALELLAKDYATDKRVGEIVESLGLAPPAADQFLLAVLDKNLDRNVKARACLSLASRYKNQAELAQINSTQRTVAPSQEEREQFARRIAKSREEANRKYEASANYFERTIKEFGDAPCGDRWTMGEYAKGLLFEVRNLVVGKTAPEVEGEDIQGQKLKLGDYRGQVVLLDFYWWGNTPRQCIQPFEQSLAKKFAGRPFVLLGISRDQDREALKKIREDEQISWRSWFDGVTSKDAVHKPWFDYGPMPGPIAVRWSVRVWPTLYLLDHKGVIRAKNLASREMEGLVEKLVQEAETDAKTRAKP